MTRPLAFAVIFVAGTLVGGALLPRAAAQPAPIRYQYNCVTKMDGKIWQPEVLGYLNQVGQQGWRLMENRLINRQANVDADVYCFERRL